MIHARANAIFAQLICAFLVALTSGCSFTGTEVGNGNKPDSGSDRKNKKSASDKVDEQASTEKPKIAQAGEPLDKSRSNESDDEELSDRDSLESAQDSSIGAPAIGVPTSPGGMTNSQSETQTTPDPLLVLLATNCASPFSHNLATPIQLISANPALVKLTIHADLIDNRWNLSRVGSTERLFLEPKTDMFPFGVKARNEKGEQVGHKYTCSDFSVSDSATITNRSGVYKKISAKISTQQVQLSVSWYLDLTEAGNEKYKLLQYEYQTLPSGNFIVLREP